MLSVHIIPHATDIGISPILAAGILSVMQGACAIGNFISGRTNDIIGGRMSMILCLTIMVIAIAVLLIGGPVWVFYVVAFLVGIGIGGAVTLRSTIVAELFGLRSHGAITGAILSISSIGCAVGPLIAGYIFDISNQYQPTFVITMGICVTGLAMACLLKFKYAVLNKEHL